MSLERIIAHNIYDLNDKIVCSLNIIDVCKSCHTALIPGILSGYFMEHENKFTIFLVCFCPKCKNVLLCKYQNVYMQTDNTSSSSKKPLAMLTTSSSPTVVPYKNKEKIFPQEISRISPA